MSKTPNPSELHRAIPCALIPLLLDGAVWACLPRPRSGGRELGTVCMGGRRGGRTNPPLTPPPRQAPTTQAAGCTTAAAFERMAEASEAVSRPVMDVSATRLCCVSADESCDFRDRKGAVFSVCMRMCVCARTRMWCWFGFGVDLSYRGREGDRGKSRR